MKRALFIIATLVLLLIPCGAAYAYDGAGADESPVTIEPADPALAPDIELFGNDELVHGYRYMNLNVGIYIQTGTDSWEKLSATSYPDMYLTMQNGLVNFTLPGGATYKVTVESGCYRSYPITSGKSIAIPSFYLTAS
jgi:hypothetical protein